MAHFEDGHHRRISGEEITIRVGQNRTIYLWGGVVDGHNLTVTSSSPAALQIEESSPPNNQYRRFTLHARADTGSVDVTVSQTGGPSWDSLLRVGHAAATWHYPGRTLRRKTALRLCWICQLLFIANLRNKLSLRYLRWYA
jgi:hypothetical protein